MQQNTSKYIIIHQQNTSTKYIKIHQNTSKFAEKVDLTNLKSNLDKLNIDKFKNVTVI